VCAGPVEQASGHRTVPVGDIFGLPLAASVGSRGWPASASRTALHLGQINAKMTLISSDQSQASVAKPHNK
jgi:hypothetical protein